MSTEFTVSLRVQNNKVRRLHHMNGLYIMNAYLNFVVCECVRACRIVPLIHGTVLDYSLHEDIF